MLADYGYVEQFVDLYGSDIDDIGVAMTVADLAGIADGGAVVKRYGVPNQVEHCLVFSCDDMIPKEEIRELVRRKMPRICVVYAAMDSGSKWFHVECDPRTYGAFPDLFNDRKRLAEEIGRKIPAMMEEINSPRRMHAYTLRETE